MGSVRGLLEEDVKTLRSSLAVLFGTPSLCVPGFPWGCTAFCVALCYLVYNNVKLNQGIIVGNTHGITTHNTSQTNVYGCVKKDV